MRRDGKRRTGGPQSPRQLGSANVLCLQALRPARDFELHFLAFLQGLETFHLDRRMMAEDIFAAIILGDETKPLRIVEPLYCTACHENYSPYWGGGCRAIAMKPHRGGQQPQASPTPWQTLYARSANYTSAQSWTIRPLRGTGQVVGDQRQIGLRP